MSLLSTSLLFIFVCCYRFFKTLDVAQLVHTFEKTGLGKRVDRECNHLPIGERDSLGFEIDGDFGVRGFFGQIEQGLMRFFIHDDGEQAVLEGIVAEDVSEGSADNSPEPVAG